MLMCGGKSGNYICIKLQVLWQMCAVEGRTVLCNACGMCTMLMCAHICAMIVAVWVRGGGGCTRVQMEQPLVCEFRGDSALCA